MKQRVTIVGGGLAGLCCAIELQNRGFDFLLLEAADAVGGRIRTDVVEGFRLDRGFQVFLDSYPEPQKLLDFDKLNLQPFLPGALVRFNNRFHNLADPWRRPSVAIQSIFSPIGSLGDKLRISRFRSQCLRGTIEDQFQQPEMTTLAALQEEGFSEAVIDRFFRPFLGGVFLDRDLATSRRMCSFVFRMFSQGRACLPAEGMEAIPAQLAARLPAEKVRLRCEVGKVEPGIVKLATGEIIESPSIVVSTEGPVAAKLTGGDFCSEKKSVTCLYFVAEKSPIHTPSLVLNGDGEGPINNLCVPTDIASSYGPEGKSLISVTVLGNHEDESGLIKNVQGQLRDWFGEATLSWRHLRTYNLSYALPDQASPALEEPQRQVRFAQGIYVCGDHRDNASIQGAMVSGRRAAEAIVEDSGE